MSTTVHEDIYMSLGYFLSQSLRFFFSSALHPDMADAAAAEKPPTPPAGGGSIRTSVVSDSFRLAKKGDTKVDALSVVSDIVAMGTRSALAGKEQTERTWLDFFLVASGLSAVA